jgi:hypothetical protein
LNKHFYMIYLKHQAHVYDQYLRHECEG